MQLGHTLLKTACLISAGVFFVIPKASATFSPLSSSSRSVSLDSVLLDHKPIELVTVSGGIAITSIGTAPFTNPAAVVDGANLIVVLQGGYDSSFSNSLGKGGLTYASRTYGIAAGGTFSTPTNASQAYFTVGTTLDSLNLEIGFSAIIGTSSSAITSYDLGFLYKPAEAVHFGVVGRGIDSGGNVRELDLGLSVRLSESLIFVTDVALSNGLGLLVVQPGLRWGSQKFAFTASYGSASSTGHGSSLLNNNDVSVGVGFALARHAFWEIYYNRFTTYYTGISFRF